MKILVVDDDKMTLIAIAKMLEGKGYEVITSSNSVEALKLITDEKIDLVISDIMMPAISGFTLSTMLKNFYFSKIPLILMSGYPVDNTILTSHGLENADFISKPIDFAELDGKIKGALPH